MHDVRHPALSGRRAERCERAPPPGSFERGSLQLQMPRGRQTQLILGSRRGTDAQNFRRQIVRHRHRTGTEQCQRFQQPQLVGLGALQQHLDGVVHALTFGPIAGGCRKSRHRGERGRGLDAVCPRPENFAESLP